MESESDKILFERIKGGDRLALNELFGLYYSGLCRFATSYVTFPESEELVSDLFVAIWQQRQSIRIEKSVRAYLFASVKYSCYKLVSSKKPVVNLDDIDLEATLLLSDNPHETLVYEEFQNHISKSLQKLPPRCRQIFVMNRFDTLKYKEIAEILSISEKTVENQIVKALQLMRESLLYYQKA